MRLMPGLICLICCCGLRLFAQTPVTLPISNSAPRTVAQDIAASEVGQVNTHRSNGMQSNPIDFDSNQLRILNSLIKPLYRSPTENELKEILVEQKHREENKLFLSQKNTGIFRLIADLKCSENQFVLNVSDRCIKYQFPGNGSSYSFRTKSYRLWRLADLSFADNKIYSVGKYQQGLMVNLGDVPIENVGEDYEGSEFVRNYSPISDAKLAQDDFLKFQIGKREGNRKYSSILTAETNSTYLLRSIAFRGKYQRIVGGIPYDEFKYDKRSDVIVAFRIVEKDVEKGITIIWKILAQKSSPKLSRKK